MKNPLLILIISCFFFIQTVTPAFANNKNNINSIENMIEDKMFLTETGLSKIQELSRGISYDEKERILIKFEQSPIVGSVINLISGGLGIGSFIIGDIISGIISISISAVAFTTLALDTSAFMGPGITGVIIILAGVLYGIGSPFVYTNNYNSRLKRALSINSRYSINYKEEKLSENFNIPLISLNF